MIFVSLALAEEPIELRDATSAPGATEPRAVLEAGAASTDVGPRREALTALIAVEAAPCDAPWTRRGRYDPSPYVQRATIAALQGRGCEALLWSWAEDATVDAHTRAVAALASGEKDPQKLGPLALGLRADGRAALFLHVAARAGEAAAAERLEKLARSGNLPLERELYLALGGDPGFPFAAALAAAEPEVQTWLAAAWFHADPGAARPTVRAYLHDRDPERVFDMIDALREEPGARALLRGVAGVDARLATGLFPGLAERQLASEQLERQLDAVATLARYPDRRGALVPLLTHEEHPVRLAVARALARDPSPAERRLLAQLLGDELLDVRVVAAAQLVEPRPPGGQLGGGEAPVAGPGGAQAE